MVWVSEKVKQARAVVASIAGWVVFLFLVVIVLLTILVELNVPGLDNRPLLLLTIVGAMIFFLRNDVFVSHEELSRKVADAHRSLTEMAGHVELMRETLHSAGKLWTLETAVEDLKPFLVEADANETIMIDHLGLDMTEAWNKICPVMEKLILKNRKRIHFRLLILGAKALGGTSGEDGAKTLLPEDVEDWLAKGDKQRGKIEKSLKKIKEAMVKAGCGEDSLVYEVRSYRDVPFVHGIRVRGPIEAAYTALSRWDETKDDPFWWGGKEYHRILCPANSQQMDLMAVLDGYFQRWWTVNAPAGAGRAAPVAQ